MERAFVLVTFLNNKQTPEQTIYRPNPFWAFMSGLGCPAKWLPIPLTHPPTHKAVSMGGVFAQCAHSAHTAPVITVFIPGTHLKSTHLQKRA